MSRQVVQPPESSLYADEGTAAHALSELFARRQLIEHQGVTALDLLNWRTTHGHAILDEEEMLHHAQAYVELLREKMSEHPNTVLLLEQRVPTGIPSCWGTSDAVLVSPSHVEIVDLKYGKGIFVSVRGNPQLRLYGVGALEAFGELLGDVETVTMTVYQPRLSNTASETLKTAELVAWRDSLIPVAERALGHDAEFHPSDDACRWCPANGQCKAQFEWATMMDFGVVPEIISDEELGTILLQIPMIEQWCAAVRAYALDRVYDKGATVPGYKVVLSSGQRYVADPAQAIEALEMIGYSLNEIVNTKIKGIGDLEKLLGRKGFHVLDPFVRKTDGKPSLVPDDDPRQATNSLEAARKDFE